MEKKTDKELLQDIVAIYFKSRSTTELDKTLKEYIKNNKLTKTYNTLSEFKTNYTNEHNFFKKENKINNTEIKENSKK